MFLQTLEPRDSKVDTLVTWDSQEKAIRKLVERIGGGKKGRAGGVRDIAVKKSRDQGGTLIVLAVVLWFWLFRPHSNILLSSRNEKQVYQKGNPKALFSKIEFFLAALPRWLRPKGFSLKAHLRKNCLVNPELGGTITGESTTSNLSKGDRQLCVVMDELPAFEEIAPGTGEEAWRSAEAATDCRIAIGTFNGVVGIFPEIIKRLEEDGGEGIITMAWWDRPEHREGLYASRDNKLILLDAPYWEKRLGRKLDGKQTTIACFNAPDAESPFEGIVLAGKAPGEYPFILDGRLRSPFYDTKWKRHHGNVRFMAEEFDMLPQAAGGMYFSQDIIDRHLANTREPISSGELVVLDKERATSWDYRRYSEKKELRLWCQLDGNGNPPLGNYGIGGDISYGTGASNTCFSVFSKATGEKVAEWVCATLGTSEAAKVYVALARWFYDAKLCPEYNGPGVPFTSHCIEHLQYTNFLRRDDGKPGWHHKQDGKSKDVLLTEYQDALAAGKITNHSREALEEMRAFVHGDRRGEPSHKAETATTDPSGARDAHGDRVIADALAWLCLQDVAIPTHFKPTSKGPPPESFAWRRLLDANTENPNEYSWAAFDRPGRDQYSWASFAQPI